MTERRFTSTRTPPPGFYDDDHDSPPAIRQVSDTKMRLRGYASVFDFSSGDLGGFRETIAPGAFAKSLRNNDDVVALYNHDSSLVLARSTAGTLKLSEDRFGLLCDIHVAETQIGRDTYESVSRRDLRQMSFAFIVLVDRWEQGRDSLAHRTIIAAELIDVSVVTWPAYSQTIIDVAGRAASLVEMIAQRHELGPDIDTMRRQLRLQELA